MKFNHLIVDASSIINFFKYYHSYYVGYDKKEKKPEFKLIFKDLKEFLVSKIVSGDIIVLDKVFDELRDPNLDYFKSEIENYVVNSMEVFEDVTELITKYRIYENEKFYNDNPVKINAELELYENRYADLFLIAYANKLKKGSLNPLLITEESFKPDSKLIPKLPFLCKRNNEHIFCRNLPYSLFEFYKDELYFNLIVKST